MPKTLSLKGLINYEASKINMPRHSESNLVHFEKSYFNDCTFYMVYLQSIFGKDTQSFF